MKNILIAEDDKFLSSAYKLKFGKAGWETTIVHDGTDVIEYLKSDKVPKVILLDLIMPEMDGFSVLEAIMANAEWKKIPVVVASNLGQKEDIDKAKALGAADFVIKSDIQLEDLVRKMDMYV